ncbi:MAG: restriction endonuclease subunit S [Leucobacter sp.]
MITTATLPALLGALGFAEHRGVWTKSYGDHGELVVDTRSQKISYPGGVTVNEATTANFGANENFVVLECVDALLAKGYKPEHIELEPRWKLGHGASGGRADILVRDHDGEPLLLIECKTYGQEFDQEWQRTLNGGGQLFSYAQQISGIRFLCLYASTLEDGAPRRVNHIIAHIDNDAYLEDAPRAGSYATARTVEERHRVWQEVYRSDFLTHGVFEDAVQPYLISRDKPTLDALAPLSAADSRRKFNEFATILRQNNVSGREKAFDTLVNLFLCKLVDEAENPDDLQFYWRGVAYDSHFDLLERLQRLYKRGMDRFLSEDITYVSTEDVVNALRFVSSDEDATERAVLALFHRQKFFTNSDFSFVDVHNERLFYENAAILLRVVQMWQDVRLSTGSDGSQFLGDMFEMFLDEGIKQSEGQFFTPIPLCRFILRSLPVEEAVLGPSESTVIDYACGAGHFLTEFTKEIERIEPHRDWGGRGAELRLVGIEKEYRLSKVAKVSAFMHGRPEIEIRYEDALSSGSDDLNGRCEVLVANPPYSVKGFLETLTPEDRARFETSRVVDQIESNGNIEAFFVERTAQLLAPGGLAAVILPASILTNGGRVHVAARRVLLEFFDLISVVELGSGTFGKTGTNTVTLFLRRKQADPEPRSHFGDRVAHWVNGEGSDSSSYVDEDVLVAYAARMSMSVDEYRGLLRGEPSGTSAELPIVRQYRRRYEAHADTRRMRAKRGHRMLDAAGRSRKEREAFAEFVRSRETVRLHAFALAVSQPNEVVVVRAPEKSKELKSFLGYEWSSAKGDAGIHVFTDSAGRHSTPLYNPDRVDDPEKISTVIRAAYAGRLDAVPDEVRSWVSLHPLVSLLPFDDAEFNGSISLSPSGPTARIPSAYPARALSEIAEIRNGSTPDTSNEAYWPQQGGVPWVTMSDMTAKYVAETERSVSADAPGVGEPLPVGSVLWSSRATIGQVALSAVPLVTNQGFKTFITGPDVSNEYLYYLLETARPILEGLVPTGSKFKEINTTRIGNVEIPVPPIEVQREIVRRCSELDEQNAAHQDRLRALRSEIDEAHLELDGRFEQVTLGEVATPTIGGTPSRRDRRYFDGPHLWASIRDLKGGTVTETIETISDDAVAASNVKLIPAGTTLLSFKLSIGRIGVAGADMYTNEAIAGLVPRDRRTVTDDFLFAYFASAGLESATAGRKAFGRSLNSEHLRDQVRLPLPPMAAQKRFSKRVKQLIDQHRDLELRVTEARRRKGEIVQEALNPAIESLRV